MKRLLALLLLAQPVLAQGDPRVMMQGFVWESNSQGASQAHQPAPRNWYAQVEKNLPQLVFGKFDLIWLPPPSQGNDTGYYPTEYFSLRSSYGGEKAQRQLLAALLRKGIEPVADLVLNHRNGTTRWADFSNPNWDTTAIASGDEFWSAPDSLLQNPSDRRDRDANRRGHPDTGMNNEGARDLDHHQPVVRRDVKKYLQMLREAGYRGWRYDQVKGYGPEFVAEYNRDSRPSFSVGEYWDGLGPIEEWLNGMAGTSLAFDFPTFYALKERLEKQDYRGLAELTRADSPGLLGRRPGDAVTFLENHDTGFPQHARDTFPREGPMLMQGYALILTHPGIPCVYWKHYFEWGYGPAIARLTQARKSAGVNSQSYVSTRMEDGAYVAEVGDRRTPSSTLIVRIGPGGWEPDAGVFGLEASGEGYAVWVRKSMKAGAGEDPPFRNISTSKL